MAWSNPAAILVVVIALGNSHSASVQAEDSSNFAGQWILNRELSQLPREIGFRPDWISTAGSGTDSTAAGGRGRRGSGGGGTGAFTARPESDEDARRKQQLTAAVRNPSSRLTIVETPIAVTITDDRGQSRTFHPNGKEEVLQLDGVSVEVTAKRESGRIVVLYRVEQGHELRYTYSRGASDQQLVVEVQFIERGAGDHVRRVYEQASAAETPTAAAATILPATVKQGAGVPAVSASDAGKEGTAVSANRLAAQAVNRQPDAALKGLTKLGVVVEDLSSQAMACGLDQGVLETAVSKSFSDAGFRILRNSDEDTYVYVNVITSSLSNGLCVSRYDAFLYTHATAKLAYQETAVPVQVSLLHKGGIAGGASAAHAQAVLRGVREYVDQFSTRIRDANK